MGISLRVFAAQARKEIAAMNAAQRQFAAGSRQANAAAASSTAQATAANQAHVQSSRAKVGAIRSEMAAVRTAIASERQKRREVLASVAAGRTEIAVGQQQIAQINARIAAQRAERASLRQNIAATRAAAAAERAKATSLGAGAAAALRNSAAMQAMATATTAAATAARALASSSLWASITSWGSRMQWAGRQLQHNFTMPLLLAAGVATKFALDAETAMVRVEKVYGDALDPTREFKEELESLGGAFEALSEHYGVNRAEVIEMAGTWAQAGASGVALAESVRLSLDAMLLGELDSQKAVTSLIAIQAQYGQTTEELKNTLATLNMVENETGITMGGLIDVMSRSAGVARSAGVDIRHLGAMAAAIVPAAGEATRAGNGLRTIITRLLSPTTAAADVMGLMGINVSDLGWQSMTATQRLEHMADQFNNLDAAQRAHVSTVIAGRYQVNRFEVLMRDIGSSTGYYQRALEVTADAQRNLTRYTDELNTVLSSNPRRMQQIWVMLQNAMANIIQPLIPIIIGLGRELVNLVQRFAALSPETQKWIFLGFGLLAVLGLVGTYIGATSVLFGMFGQMVAGAATASLGFLKFFGALVALPFKAVAGGLLAVGGAVTGMFTRMIAGSAAINAAGGFGAFLIKAWSGAITTAASVIAVGGKFLGGLVWSRLLLPIYSAITLGGNLALVPAIGNLFRSMFASFADWFTRLGTFLFAAGGDLMAPLTNGIARGFGLMRSGLSRLGGAIFGPSGDIMVQLTNGLSAMLRGVVGWVTPFFTALVSWIKPAWLAFVGAWKGLMAIQLTGSNGLFAMMVNWGKKFIGFFTGLPAMIGRGFAALWPMLLTGLKAGGAKLLAVVLGWPGLIAAAVVTLVAVLWNPIKNMWDNVTAAFSNGSGGIVRIMTSVRDFFAAIGQSIANVFNSLPDAVQKPIMAVVNFVRDAAMKVYEWFQYLNPFARHSPSLVEQVTAGMQIIRGAYNSVSNVGGAFAAAARDLAIFKSAIAALPQWTDERANVGAAMPGNLGTFDRIVGHIRTLNRVLDEQRMAWARQETVVQRAQRALDRATEAQDAHQASMDRTKARLDELQTAYDAHSEALNNFAGSGIAGQRAMSDAIFENELAQKRLRLEMMQMEDAGQGVDSMRDRLASLQGDIEYLRGNVNDLRSAGAGSDILGPIEAQIAAMEAEYRAIQQGVSGSPVSQLQSELEALQRQGEILQLEEAIQFDPLTRQIDQLANSMEELPFNEIISGIQRESAAMARLEPQIDRVSAEYGAMEQTQARLTQARDRAQAAYDRESASLQVIQDDYRNTASAISEMEDALRGVSAAAADQIRAAGGDPASGGTGRVRAGSARGAASSLSPAERMFLDAEGGDFPDPGGYDIIGGREDWADQSALIDQWTQELAMETGDLWADIDMFGGLRDAWESFKDWWSTNVSGPWGEMLGGIRDGWQEFVAGFTSDGGGPFAGVAEGFSTAWEKIKEFWDNVVNFLGDLWELFGPQLRDIWDNFVEALGPAWDTISEALEPLKELFSDVWDTIKTALEMAWPVIKVILGLIGGAITLVASVVLNVIANVIGPAIQFISSIIAAIVRVVTGVWQIVIGIWDMILGVIQVIVGAVKGLFTGDWTGVQAGWERIKKGAENFGRGFLNVIGGLVDAVVAAFWWFIDTLVGIVKGLVEGIVDWFLWLWDILVGNSIIPDMIEAIVQWFQNAWDWIVDKVSGMVKAVVQWFQNLWDSAVDKVNAMVGAVVGFFARLYADVAKWALDLYVEMRRRWESIKTAISDKAREIWNAVKGFFQNLWNDIVGLVTRLRDEMRRRWDNIKTAIIDKAQEIWQGARDKFNDVRTTIMSIVDNLRTRVTDRFNSIRDRIMDAFHYVRDRIRGVFTRITDHIKSGINVAIRAVNGLIRGLNKVADILPGLNWSISLIPELAAGGQIPSRQVGAGFVSNQARAIVGEGNSNYPEFVIPTDPSHRKRAEELYSQLGRQLKIANPSDDPALNTGGPVDTIKGWIGNGANLIREGVDWMANVARGAVSTIFRPFKESMEARIANMSWQFGRRTASSLLSNVWGWVTNADEAYREAEVEAGGVWKKPMNRYRITSRYGMRTHPVTGGRMLHAGTDLANGGGSAIYAASGGSVIRAGFNSLAGRTGLGLALQHANNIISYYGHLRSASVSQGSRVTPGQRIGTEGATGRVTGPHLHFEIHNGLGSTRNPESWMRSMGVPLAKGGIMRARYGGTLARIGEAGRDEAVIPLPTGWENMLSRSTMPPRLNTLRVSKLVVVDSAEGATAERVYPVTNNDNRSYHFHGDLSFPNIDNGEDAEAFIRNLTDLAGGK